MINILFPMNKKSVFFDSQKYSYPSYMTEINNKTILEHVIRSYTLNDIVKYIFVLNKQDCEDYYVDNVTKLLTKGICENVILDQETKGSSCTCLMAVDYIDNNMELIVANSDQIFYCDLNSYLCKMRDDNIDAGVLYFETVHPRWSFIKMDQDDNILETAEKRPISNYAIAGFYYFRSGSLFVDAAKKSIKRGVDVKGSYFVSMTINELILLNYKVRGYKLKENEFKSLYSPEKVEDWRKEMRK